MISQDEFNAFTEDMLSKQAQNDDEKGDMYKTESLTALVNMLQLEVNELKEAIVKYLHADDRDDHAEREAVRLECGDVGNFAAFIHTHMNKY